VEVGTYDLVLDSNHGKLTEVTHVLREP